MFNSSLASARDNEGTKLKLFLHGFCHAEPDLSGEASVGLSAQIKGSVFIEKHALGLQILPSCTNEFVQAGVQDDRNLLNSGVILQRLGTPTIPWFRHS